MYTTRSHPSVVPAHHDERPSDPSPPPPPTAAAPAILVAADSTLPRFSIVLGASTGIGLASTAGGGGPGAGRPAPASGGEDENEAPTVSAPAYLVSSGRPEYPPSARASGVEADVELEIVVDSHGRVVDSKLLRHGGYGFDESALKAIRTYRFAPAQYEGAPVRVRMHWTVAFRLE
jgi:protein TonB